MKREDKLQDLFREINKKPEDLDDKIMLAVFKEVETREQEVKVEDTSWTYTGILLAVFGVAGILYAFSKVNLQDNPLIWIIFLSVIFPLSLDKFLSIRMGSKYH